MAFKMSPKGSVAKKACSPLKMGIKTTKTTAPKSIKVSKVKKSPVKKYNKSPMKMDQEKLAKAKNVRNEKMKAAGFKGDPSNLTPNQQVALQKLGGQAMKQGLNTTYITKKRNEILGKGKEGGEASPNKFLGKLARKVGKNFKNKAGKVAQKVKGSKALKTAGKMGVAGKMIKNKRAGKPAMQGTRLSKALAGVGLGRRKAAPTKKRNRKK